MDICELRKLAGIITENDEAMYQKDPRSFAINIVEQGLVDPMKMLIAALQYMSYQDVRDMLDANELSPRFGEDDY